MSQSMVSFNLTDSQITTIDAALNQLESALADLVSLTTKDKQRCMPMGERSETFCRQALRVLSENPQVVPPNLNVAEAVRDLSVRDQLKPRAIRLGKLVSKMDDTDYALGADAMHVATRGYSLLKVIGRTEGLDDFRKELSVRFSKPRRAAKEEKNAA